MDWLFWGLVADAAAKGIANGLSKPWDNDKAARFLLALPNEKQLEFAKKFPKAFNRLLVRHNSK